MLEQKDIKTTLQKVMFQIVIENVIFMIKKVKNTVPRTYVISDHKDEEIVGTFYKKELQK